MAGIEPYGLGYRGHLTIRTPTFRSPDDAKAARDELLEATRRLRLKQRIRRMQQELSSVAEEQP